MHLISRVDDFIMNLAYLLESWEQNKSTLRDFKSKENSLNRVVYTQSLFGIPYTGKFLR